MTCLRFYVLYIISVSSGRRKGDNGKQCAMKSRLQLKRFPSPAKRAYRETKRQSDSQPARRTDNQRERERKRETETDREGEMKTVLLTLQQLHC